MDGVVHGVSMKNWLIAVVLGACFGIAYLPASGANVVWTNATGNGWWKDGNNWVGGSVPAAGDNVEIGADTNVGAKVYLTNAVADSRTVGKITFNSAGGSGIYPNGTPNVGDYYYLTVTNGITVAAATNYTIAMTYPAAGGYVSFGGPNVWDVTAGGQLNLSYANSAQFRANGYSIDKRGPGLVFLGLPSGQLGGLTVSDGTLQLSVGGAIPLAPGITSLSGTGTITGHGTVLIATNDTVWQGAYSASRLPKRGWNKFTVNANGKLTTSFFCYDGTTLELDNSVTPVNNRGGGAELHENSIYRLIGSGAQSISEATAATMHAFRGLQTIEVRHGAGNNAALSFNYAANMYSHGTYTYANDQGGMMRLIGDGMGSNQAGGYSRVTITFPTYYNGNLTFPGWTRVGEEFAVNGTYGIGPMSTSGRAVQIDAATSNDNVLAQSAQNSLTGDRTNNTLKIDGAYPVNLGGNTLTLRMGGLIQRGAANIISNGTLRCFGERWWSPGVPTITNNWLYCQNTSDLIIDANIDARGVAKCGAGKLTLKGANVPAALNWCEGPLELGSNITGNITIPTQIFDVIEPTNGAFLSASSLIKDGTNTVTLTDMNRTTGGMRVKNGVLALGSGTEGDNNESYYSFTTYGTLGTGPVELGTPAKLWIARDYAASNNFQASGTIVMNQTVDATGTPYTVTSQGGYWSPGGTNAAGKLTIQGSLVWTNNGTTRSTLEIEIGNTGVVAGVDYDQLVVTGKVWGLSTNTAPANAGVDLVVKVERHLRGISGNTYTILSGATNFTGLVFNNVIWDTPSSTGTVSYLNGSITLSSVKITVRNGALFLIR